MDRREFSTWKDNSGRQWTVEGVRAVGHCLNEVNGGKELRKFVIHRWAPRGCGIVFASFVIELPVRPWIDFRSRIRRILFDVSGREREIEIHI